MTGDIEPRYLVWSNEHSAWWRPARCGYTIILVSAGRYSRAEAIEICADARNANGVPSEIPVREEDAMACLLPETRAAG